MFLCDCGQLDGEGRALARLAVDGNPAVVSPHSFLHDRQAESSASAGLFGGEKGLENLRGMIRLNAVSRVGDFDRDRARLMQSTAQRNRICRGRAQTERPSGWHRLKGIFDQVVERLLHVLPVRLDEWKIRGQFRYASHVLALAFHTKEAGGFP